MILASETENDTFLPRIQRFLIYFWKIYLQSAREFSVSLIYFHSYLVTNFNSIITCLYSIRVLEQKFFFFLFWFCFFFSLAFSSLPLSVPFHLHLMNIYEIPKTCWSENRTLNQQPKTVFTALFLMFSNGMTVARND